MLTLAPLLLAAPALGPIAPAPLQSPAKQAQAYLESLEAHGWSGTVLIDQKKRRILHEGYGLADRGKGVPCGPETLYEIASTTKAVTAVAVLALVDAGELELDASIAELLPSVPDEHKRITVQQLLSHTSGMPRSATGGFGEDLATAVQGYFSSGRAGRPGSYEYWNGGYALLAGIIEEVTGRPYTEAVRELVYEPAKMASSGFCGDDLPAERQAIGYGTRGDRPAAGHPYGGSYGWQYRGMGGVVTSAPDLVRFVRALGSTKLLKRKTVERMWKPVDGGYGLGWRIQASGPKRVGHGGDVDGFHASLQYEPKGGSTVVVLTNSELQRATLVGANLEAILDGKSLPHWAPPTGKAWKSRDLEALAGEYEMEGGGRALVEVCGNGVRVVATEARSMDLLGISPQTAEIKEGVTSMGQLLDAIQAGDAATVGESVGGNAPADWGQDLARKSWPEHVREHGPLQQAVLVDARDVGNGFLAFWYRLEHDEGISHIKSMLLRGKLTYFSFAPDTIPSPGALHLGPGPKTRQLVGYDLKSESRAVEAKVDKSGIQLRFSSGRELTLERTK